MLASSCFPPDACLLGSSDYCPGRWRRQQQTGPPDQHGNGLQNYTAPEPACHLAPHHKRASQHRGTSQEREHQQDARQWRAPGCAACPRATLDYPNALMQHAACAAQPPNPDVPCHLHGVAQLAAAQIGQLQLKLHCRLCSQIQTAFVALWFWALLSQEATPPELHLVQHSLVLQLPSSFLPADNWAGHTRTLDVHQPAALQPYCPTPEQILATSGCLLAAAKHPNLTRRQRHRALHLPHRCSSPRPVTQHNHTRQPAQWCLLEGHTAVALLL
jgi:hypothetical protein